MSNGAPAPAAKPAEYSRGFHRACYLIAAAVTILWFSLYARYRQDGLCDEAGHMGILYHFAEAKPGLPDNLTTPPGYHFVVLTLSRGHPNDTKARLTTLLFALLGLVAFAGAWREFHRAPAGAATLLFALLPIMQPFAGMAYSDVPGVAVLLWAWWAQLRGNYFAAAVLLTLSCLIRQTNIVWGAFFLAWEFARAATEASWRSAFLVSWQRGRWLLLPIAGCVWVALAAGRFTPSMNHGNEFKANLATLYTAGLLVILLGLPVWLMQSRRRPGLFSVFKRTSPAGPWSHCRRPESDRVAHRDVHESSSVESRAFLAGDHVHVAAQLAACFRRTLLSPPRSISRVRGRRRTHIVSAFLSPAPHPVAVARPPFRGGAAGDQLTCRSALLHHAGGVFAFLLGDRPTFVLGHGDLVRRNLRRACALHHSRPLALVTPPLQAV